MLSRATVILALLVLFLAAAPAALANQSIVIDKSINQLYFYQNDQLAKVFPVATGKHPGLTPEGTFTIVSKVVNPYYGKLNIPGGSPQNPLGVRWLGLSIGGGGVYGIHGNSNPASIGTYASAGCIRMHNQDVIWLYDRVPPGTKVQIVSGSGTAKKAPPTPAPPAPIFLAVNGQKLDLPPEQQPYLLESSSFLPLRPVAEHLNYQLSWDAVNSGIQLSGGGQTVTFQAGQDQLVANGVAMELEQAPRLVGSTTYVPAHFFRDILKLKVDWDNDSRVINVSGAKPGQTNLPGPL